MTILPLFLIPTTTFYTARLIESGQDMLTSIKAWVCKKNSISVGLRMFHFVTDKYAKSLDLYRTRLIHICTIQMAAAKLYNTHKRWKGTQENW